MKICIDPGHGGDARNGDTGAVYNNVQEDDFNLIVASLVSANLNANGFSVVQTRGTDNFVTLQKRCEISNDTDCDLFISIHANASNNAQANGFEVLYYSEQGKSLASAIADKFAGMFQGMKNRGVVYRDNLYVLKKAKAVSALVECGFLSNDKERELLIAPGNLIKMASAIAQGVIYFCNSAGAK